MHFALAGVLCNLAVTTATINTKSDTGLLVLLSSKVLWMKMSVGYEF